MSPFMLLYLYLATAEKLPSQNYVFCHMTTLVCLQCTRTIAAPVIDCITHVPCGLMLSDKNVDVKMRLH